MTNETNNLSVLKGESRMGDFVHNGQTMGTQDGFRNVSKIWLDKTWTYDQALEQVAQDQRMIEDITAPLSAFTPKVNGLDEFVFEYQDGRQFKPTDFALGHLAVMGRTSSWMLSDLTQPKENPQKAGEILFQRDRRDAELLATIIKGTLWQGDRFDLNKPRLWRTWSDGTLRAVLSDKYAIVNNQWVLETMCELIPGGRVSHWRGDADNIYGNILIPDTIREETDSDYGGMLSIGNSEIGQRRISSCPSVFRAICMNGCIWDQVSGQAIRQVHRGNVDLVSLKAKISENLLAQIPLVNQGIERMLNTRLLGCDGASMLSVVGQVAKDFKLSKKLAAGVWKAYEIEQQILGKDAETAFGVSAALTRYGQELANDQWVSFDELGGAIVNMKPEKWQTVVSRAKSMDAEDLENIYGSLLAV